jgi:hypothetical protein
MFLACSDPREVALPEAAAWTTDATFQAALTDLEPAEQARLEAFRQRYQPGGAMAGMPWTPGTRIRHALDEQARYDELTAGPIAEQKRREAERRAQVDALTAILTPRLLKVAAESADWREGRGAALYAQFRFQNNDTRQVTGFKGRITLKKGGRSMAELPVLVAEPVGGRSSVEWRHDFEVVEGSASQQQLATSAPEDLEVVWEPASIGFADGTILTLPESRPL